MKKGYHAVGKRCAVVLESLRLSLSSNEIMTLLEGYGFTCLDVDIMSTARSRIGNSKYVRGADMCHAPHVFDCSSFIKWSFGERGFWLPRFAIQQREYGTPVDMSDRRALDLVFTTNGVSFWSDDPTDSVGHVGLLTGRDTVIHAAKKSGGVVETSLDDFIGEQEFRGVRRYFPVDKDVYTVSVPDDVEIESADDIRYFILSQLPRKQWK